ncbi:MAG: universal stress protein [Gelidibacter sp.]|uniref:universal stress protein n=1 Tax=Gelidibacter sp. TaxID=2018083 RepID=UPI003267AF2C
MTSKKLNILVPTDFSDNAANALHYALKLYANQQCVFYVLHSTYVDEAVTRAFGAAYVDDNENKAATNTMNALIAQTGLANANAKHEFIALQSKKEIKTAVKKAVKKNAIDMVVMGTKGTTGAVEYLMGSNTIKVIRNIGGCPVLILPDGFAYVQPNQIAFPTDFKRNYEIKELQALKDLSDLYGSKIRIVHVKVNNNLSETQEIHMNILKNYLEDYEHSFDWLPDTSTKSKAIAAFIEDQKIDMLAMVNYKHGMLENILKEPVIKKLAFHPTIPILVIPK